VPVDHDAIHDGDHARAIRFVRWGSNASRQLV
jgi:hypothetical protein